MFSYERTDCATKVLGHLLSENVGRYMFLNLVEASRAYDIRREQAESAFKQYKRPTKTREYACEKRGESASAWHTWLDAILAIMCEIAHSVGYDCTRRDLRHALNYELDEYERGPHYVSAYSTVDFNRYDTY